MNRIYLSKSNCGSELQATIVRSILQANQDTQVVEHKGGSYSNHELLKCNALLVLPAAHEDNDNKHYHLGKGQYCQITDFAQSQNKSISEARILIVTKVTNSYFEYKKIESVKLLDLDWTRNYAIAESQDYIWTSTYVSIDSDSVANVTKPIITAELESSILLLAQYLNII